MQGRFSEEIVSILQKLGRVVILWWLALLESSGWQQFIGRCFFSSLVTKQTLSPHTFEINVEAEMLG